MPEPVTPISMQELCHSTISQTHTLDHVRSPCADVCAHSYPRPMFPRPGVRQTVPPCLDLTTSPAAKRSAAHDSGDTHIGRLRHGKPVASDKDFPKTFFDEEHASLLFRYFAGHDYEDY